MGRRSAALGGAGRAWILVGPCGIAGSCFDVSQWLARQPSRPQGMCRIRLDPPGNHGGVQVSPAHRDRRHDTRRTRRRRPGRRWCDAAFGRVFCHCGGRRRNRARGGGRRRGRWLPGRSTGLQIRPRHRLGPGGGRRIHHACRRAGCRRPTVGGHATQVLVGQATRSAGPCRRRQVEGAQFGQAGEGAGAPPRDRGRNRGWIVPRRGGPRGRLGRLPGIVHQRQSESRRRLETRPWVSAQ